MKKQIFLAITLLLITAGIAAAQKKFYNKEFKFGFTYPPGAKVNKALDTIDQTTDLTPLAYLDMPNTGRGLYELAAYISAGNITRAACNALSTAEDTPQKKKFGTITFAKTAYVEGGMESSQPREYYRTFQGGTCYEVRLMLSMDKYPKHPINTNAAFARLYPILRTFYIK